VKYDFSVLSPEEFEELVNKLLSKKDIVVEQYRKGRDDGYDGFRTGIPVGTMIQAKHYAKYAILKREIETKEIEKIKREKPEAYVLATSYDLTHANVVELKSIIEQHVKEVVVLGYKNICNLLDEDDKVLKSMVKLWCLNAELAKYVVCPERESRFIQLKERFGKILPKFVETPDLFKIQNLLSDEHVALIAGEPGVGKTTLAEYLCLYYLGKEFDIEIFEGDFTREKYDLSNSKKKILYYFDDFLGSNYLNCISDKSDSAIVRFIEHIKTEPYKLFLLTSRTNIVNRASAKSQFYRSYDLQNKQYIVNVGKYDDITKAKILRNHLRNSDLDFDCIQDIVQSKKYKEIINHHNFNPRLIEFITRKEKFKNCGKRYLDFVKDTLDNPKEIWEHCFNEQLNHFQRLLVRLVVMNRGVVEENILRNAYTRAIQLYKYSIPEQECVEYEYVLKICESCILCRTIEKISCPKPYQRTIVSVFNPSVSDYVLPTINNDEDLEFLCSALRTVDSIWLVKSLRVRKEKRILRSVLKKYSKDEWDDAKLELMNALNLFDDVDSFVKSVEQEDFDITPHNRSTIMKIISKTINNYDWSDFLGKNIELLRDNSLGYCNIYEVYKDSVFCQDKVLEKIHLAVVALLKEGINDRLLESYDCEFDEDITEGQIYQRFEDIQDSIKEDYLWLDESDFEAIQEGIDASQLVSEISQKAREDRWADERDDYEDYKYRVVESSSEKIDTMFLNLIQK